MILRITCCCWLVYFVLVPSNSLSVIINYNDNSTFALLTCISFIQFFVSIFNLLITLTHIYHAYDCLFYFSFCKSESNSGFVQFTSIRSHCKSYAVFCLRILRFASPRLIIPVIVRTETSRTHRYVQ